MYVLCIPGLLVRIVYVLCIPGLLVRIVYVLCIPGLLVRIVYVLCIPGLLVRIVYVLCIPGLLVRIVYVLCIPGLLVRIVYVLCIPGLLVRIVYVLCIPGLLVRIVYVLCIPGLLVRIVYVLCIPGLLVRIVYVLCIPDEKELILEINTLFIIIFLDFKEKTLKLTSKKPQRRDHILKIQDFDFIIAFLLVNVLPFWAPGEPCDVTEDARFCKFSYFEYTIEFPRPNICLNANFQHPSTFSPNVINNWHFLGTRGAL